MSCFLDVSIHKGIDLDAIIGSDLVLRIPSSHYFVGAKKFINEKPELTPYLVEASGDMSFYRIIYKYKGDVWYRIFQNGSIVLQDYFDLDYIFD